MAERDLETVFGPCGVWVTRVVDHCSATKEDLHGMPPVDRSIDPLRAAISDAIGHLSQVIEGKVPPKFKAVKERVEQGIAKRTLLTIAEFEELCREGGDPGSTEFYLQVLDGMGSIFYFGRTKGELGHLRDEYGSLPHGRRWRARDTETREGCRRAPGPAQIRSGYFRRAAVK